MLRLATVIIIVTTIVAFSVSPADGRCSFVPLIMMRPRARIRLCGVHFRCSLLHVCQAPAPAKDFSHRYVRPLQPGPNTSALRLPMWTAKLRTFMAMCCRNGCSLLDIYKMYCITINGGLVGR